MTRFNLSDIPSSEKLELQTKFGTLVAWVVRDDEDYKEFAIDLIANDGKEYQVACIGTDEYSDDPHYNDDKVHIYTWDGHDPDCCHQEYMDPNGEGYYYGPEEE